MVEIIRVDSSHDIFRELTAELDADLNARYGEKQKELTQFNKIDKVDSVVIVIVNGKPAGCGCFREFNDSWVEIKRMYVRQEFRGTGISVRILNELENWARNEEYENAVLETGTKQLEAIRFYTKCGYVQVDNYGPYIGMLGCICMSKMLRANKV